jgi:hypothetical protein
LPNQNNTIGDKAQTITKESIGSASLTGIFDNPQFKRRRLNPSIPTPKQKYWRQIPN